MDSLTALLRKAQIRSVSKPTLKMGSWRDPSHDRMALIPERYAAAVEAIIGGAFLICLTVVAPMGNRVILVVFQSLPMLFYGLGVLMMLVGVGLIVWERIKGI